MCTGAVIRVTLLLPTRVHNLSVVMPSPIPWYGSPSRSSRIWIESAKRQNRYKGRAAFGLRGSFFHMTVNGRETRGRTLSDQEKMAKAQHKSRLSRPPNFNRTHQMPPEWIT